MEDNTKVLLYHPIGIAQIINLKCVDGAKRSLIAYKQNKGQQKWKYLTTLTLDDGTFMLMFTCMKTDMISSFNEVATRIYTRPLTKNDTKKYSMLYKWFDSERSENKFHEIKKHCLYDEILFIRVDEDIDILSLNSDHFDEILENKYVKSGIKNLEYRFTNEKIEDEYNIKMNEEESQEEILLPLQLPSLPITFSIRKKYIDRRILTIRPDYYFSFDDHKEFVDTQKYTNILNIMLQDETYLSIFTDINAMENNYFMNQIGTRLITDSRLQYEKTEKLRKYLSGSIKDCDYETLQQQIHGCMYIMRVDKLQNYVEITDDILTYMFDTEWYYSALRKSDKCINWY